MLDAPPPATTTPAPPTSTASPATPRFAHLRSLDGLRGVAVVLVVLSHFAPGMAPGGFLGVDLFFVLSGFLITSLLVAEWEARDHISLPNFWLRRARRLYPALVVMIAVVLVYTMLTQNHFEVRNVALDGLAAMFYVANWRFIASGQSYILQFLERAPSPLRHTWSLAIEEQFYLVWPLVVLGVTRVARGSLRRAMVIVSLVLGGASLAWMVLLYERGASLDRLYYGTDTRVFMILGGAALGAATAGRPFLTERWSRLRPLLLIGGALGFVALLAATIWFNTSTRFLYRGGYGLVAAVLVLVLVAAAQPAPNPLARLFETRPLVGLGLISYGIYLWHWPIALWIIPDNTHLGGPELFVLRSALTLGIALVSYRVVEQPIRHGWLPNIDGRGRKLVAPALVVCLVGALAIPAVAFPSTLAPPTTRTTGQTKVALTGYAAAPRCDGPAGAALLPGKDVTVQISGNSLAAEMHTCLSEILRGRKATLVWPGDPRFQICRDTPRIEHQALEDHVVAAILFLFVALDPCSPQWQQPIDVLTEFYIAHHIHVYLVPTVPIVEGGTGFKYSNGPVMEAEYYLHLEQRDPKDVTVVDAGKFLRNDEGVYQWRMPCLPGGEAGCGPDHTVEVRFTDGVHYCSDPNYAAHGCKQPKYQAGERRAAAAIAATIVPSLTRMLAKSRPA